MSATHVLRIVPVALAACWLATSLASGQTPSPAAPPPPPSVKVGETAPDFTAPDQHGTSRRLSTLLGPVSYTHLTLPTIYSV